jgi:hypothetical protein
MKSGDISPPFLTLAVEVNCQFHALAALPPGEKTPPIPIVQEAAWAPKRQPGHYKVEKNLLLPGIKPSLVVQPLCKCYTG